MTGKSPPPAKSASGQSRDDRLKAALRANLGRRKAQAKIRANAACGGANEKTGKTEG